MASPWLIAAERFDPTPHEYLHAPVAWAQEKARKHVTDQQESVMRSVEANRYTAVHSAHDLGKSFTAAEIVCWWLDVHPPGSAFVVTTAPTGPQIKAILWREIGRLHKEIGLAGRTNLTEWYIGNEIVAYGRKPADTNPAAFQGIHAQFVLVVLDEACGIPRALFDAVDALATNEAARVLAIGNPDDPSSHFAEVCKPGSGWSVLHLDGLASPAFTDEKGRTPQDVLNVLLSETWVEERKKRWGEGSPLYQIKVRGLFPSDDPDGVVRASAMAKCRNMDRVYIPNAPELLPKELGCDIGAGGDESVIVLREGMLATMYDRNRSKDPEIVAGTIVRAIRETGATACKIDTIGWGWGVYGQVKQNVREEGLDCEIVAVNVAEASSDPVRFPLLRDELWWDIGREMTEEQAWDLSEIDDDTIADLLAPKWKPDARGRVKIEPKDETRKRLGRSPDGADALLLAYYEGSSGLERYLGQLQQEQSARHDVDSRGKIEPHPLSPPER